MNSLTNGREYPSLGNLQFHVSFVFGSSADLLHMGTYLKSPKVLDFHPEIPHFYLFFDKASYNCAFTHRQVEERDIMHSNTSPFSPCMWMFPPSKSFSEDFTIIFLLTSFGHEIFGISDTDSKMDFDKIMTQETCMSKKTRTEFISLIAPDLKSWFLNLPNGNKVLAPAKREVSQKYNLWNYRLVKRNQSERIL